MNFGCIDLFFSWLLGVKTAVITTEEPYILHVHDLHLKLNPIHGYQVTYSDFIYCPRHNFGENINQRFTHFLQLLLSWLNPFSLLFDLQICFIDLFSVFPSCENHIWWISDFTILIYLLSKVGMHLSRDKFYSWWENNATFFLDWHFFIFSWCEAFDHFDIFSGSANTTIISDFTVRCRNCLTSQLLRNDHYSHFLFPLKNSQKAKYDH